MTGQRSRNKQRLKRSLETKLNNEPTELIAKFIENYDRLYSPANICSGAKNRKTSV